MESIGTFVLPSAHRTSQLVNDTRFSSIREYLLDVGTLTGTNAIAIDDLLMKSTIFRIELIVLQGFSTSGHDSETIEIVSSDGDHLMDAQWNDPKKVGSYVSDCYYTTEGTPGELQIHHSLAAMESGLAILRLHVYNNVTEYQDLLTSDGKTYLTKDLCSVEFSQ